ncbi:hypothetical protein AHIS1636_05190 [Arthrobacter mangrovi]|uniref:Uncharacterized protein n=1 Tax=Arthrobacter mangrovi TaxID=2966350 RepID=A0ABQ5MQ11_9MICC|nr:hypothetical protein AHIS1636_05190 [Arthrobacter mangrovi]
MASAWIGPGASAWLDPGAAPQDETAGTSASAHVKRATAIHRAMAGILKSSNPYAPMVSPVHHCRRLIR